MAAPEPGDVFGGAGSGPAGSGARSLSAPIGPSEFENLMGPVLTGPVALAVSGGADSMALMHLVAEWAASKPAVDTRNGVIVFTVDHQLRPGSKAEAEFVKAAAESLGFRHRTLVWSGAKPETALQASARAARYTLMTDAIKEEGAPSDPLRCLVTAHHAEDQAETLLMRLARGSGVQGLAGMRAVSEFLGVKIIRPLLEVPKARLVATLQGLSATWCEDPSNANIDFERIRVRQAMPQLEALGFDSGRLALSAKRLARASEALDTLTTSLAVAARANRHGGAYASFDLKTWRDGPAEARIRLLGGLITANGGQREAPRLVQLEELDCQICKTFGQGDWQGATLGGCELRWGGPSDLVQVFREDGRSGLPQVILTPGQSQVWDRRFRVEFSVGPPAVDMNQNGPVSVGALGVAAYATLRMDLKHDMPALAGATLPAFFHNGELIAVPYLSDQIPRLSGPMSQQQPQCRVEALKL